MYTVIILKLYVHVYIYIPMVLPAILRRSFAKFQGEDLGLSWMIYQAQLTSFCYPLVLKHSNGKSPN